MGQAVTAEISYIVDTGEKLVNETFGPNNIRRHRTGTQVPRKMEIRNGRAVASGFSLDENGFELVEHKPLGAPPRQSIEARALAFFAA